MKLLIQVFYLLIEKFGPSGTGCLWDSDSSDR